MVNIQAWAPMFLLSISVLLQSSRAIAAQELKLDLPTAVKIALERNLELKAKSEELGMAEGRVIKSNLFLQNNPELEGDVGNFKVIKGEPEFGRNLTNFGMSLSQEFEIAGQPGYRREAAQRNLEKVGFEVSDFGRSLRFRITELFLKLLNGKAKINQAEQIVDLKNRLYEASKDRLAAGDIPGIQLTIAEFELNRAKSELISLQREYEELLSRLRTDLVLEKEESVEPVGDLTRAPLAASLDELVKSALEKRPDLAAFEQEKKVTEAEEMLARAERIPNIKLGAFYNREKQEGGYIAGGKISIPIPFFDRKQAEIREALSRKRIANLNYIQRRQALEKEVRAAFTRFKLAERDISFYPEGAMKKFDESLELYQRAYQEGAIDLADAIVFQNQVIEARLKFIDTLTVYNLSLAELKFQAGVE
jgi:cobalt-zinc-cadmium efflux system outer membrane protein